MKHMKKFHTTSQGGLFMSITIREFQVAMETYGAEQLFFNYLISGNSIPVSCFNVSGTYFCHSGSDYIVQREKRVPEEIMNRAMAEFGEKHPGGKNFWWGETHSIKGILTLATMLDGCYNKERVDELTNATYKKLLDCSSIQGNVDFPFHSIHSSKMERLYKLLAEYSNIVNPFRNKELNLKEPIQYLDAVEVTLALNEGRNYYTRLTLSINSSEAEFVDDEKGWFYDTFVPIQRNRNNGYISMGHYFLNGSDGRPVDEVVRLDYKVNRDNYKHHPNDIDLRISLKTGLAWETYKEEHAKPVTDEQINVMITHLKICIKKIRNKIVRKMINM